MANGPTIATLGVPGGQSSIYGRAITFGDDSGSPAGQFVSILSPTLAAPLSVVGTAVLVGGTVDVPVLDMGNDFVLVSYQTIGGTPGTLSVVINPGVGFTINSTSATDTSTVTYCRLASSS